MALNVFSLNRLERYRTAREHGQSCKQFCKVDLRSINPRYPQCSRCIVDGGGRGGAAGKRRIWAMRLGDKNASAINVIWVVQSPWAVIDLQCTGRNQPSRISWAILRASLRSDFTGIALKASLTCRVSRSSAARPAPLMAA
jgi:hypothetical protein